MKQLTVISGKGGTGKTSITASFAALAENHVMADGDVDAADLHLILRPVPHQEEPFYGGRAPVIDTSICNECGVCEEHCRFEAIDNLTIDPISCEGCGVCAYICPLEAITMKQKQCGKLFISETRFGPLVHAQLGIAEENSGKLIATVRQHARVIGKERKRGTIIIDGPPGIGCPVISAISGVDAVLIVTEPTLSGIHDLKRVLGVSRHFSVPALVCINKADINQNNTRQIRDYCREADIRIAGEIVYDPVVTEAMVAGKSVVEFDDGAVSKSIREIWKNVRDVLQNNCS